MKRARVIEIALSDNFESPSKKNKNSIEDHKFAPIQYCHSNSTNACRIVPLAEQLTRGPVKFNKMVLLMANVVSVLLAQSKKFENFGLIKNQGDAADDKRSSYCSEEELLQFVYKGLNLLVGKEVMCYWKLEQALSLFEWYSSQYSKQYFLELIDAIRPVLEIHLHRDEEDRATFYSHLVDGDSEAQKETLTPRSLGIGFLSLFQSTVKRRCILNLDEDGKYNQFWMLITRGGSSVELYELCSGVCGLCSDMPLFDSELNRDELKYKKMLNNEALPWRRVMNCTKESGLIYETIHAKYLRYYDWMLKDSLVNQQRVMSPLSSEETIAIVGPILDELCEHSDQFENIESNVQFMSDKIQFFEQMVSEKNIHLTEEQTETLKRITDALISFKTKSHQQ